MSSNGPMIGSDADTYNYYVFCSESADSITRESVAQKIPLVMEHVNVHYKKKYMNILRRLLSDENVVVKKAATNAFYLVLNEVDPKSITSPSQDLVTTEPKEPIVNQYQNHQKNPKEISEFQFGLNHNLVDDLNEPPKPKLRFH